MKLFLNIKTLWQTRETGEGPVRGNDMAVLPHINDAWLAVKDGLILAHGRMADMDISGFDGYEHIDLGGKMVLPTWVDSHTHLVFAEWREREFEDRIRGLSYQQIAEKGGGILNSAQKLASADENALFREAMYRLHGLIALGTGAIEIKSGYGLSLDSELKMLRVIKRIKDDAPIPVKATFLGAHAIPEMFKDRPDAYVDLIVDEMIPAVVAEGLADYIDVFCETGYFSVSQCERILGAGARHGLKAKVHVNQFNAIGGIKASVKHHALSVDHLETVSDEDLEILSGANTLPVALPACSFFLGIPYTPVRRLLDKGLPLVLASDFNPGSAPTGNMNFVWSLACIKMKMTPEEAINAMTLNAAHALELADEVGSITPGKRANFMVMRQVPSLAYLPYAFGENCIEAVYTNGSALTT